MRSSALSNTTIGIVIVLAIALAPLFCAADAQKDVDAGLIAAATAGNTANLTYWLAHGASINAKDADGNTALFKALESGKADCALVLMERGADVNVRDQRRVSYHASALGVALDCTTMLSREAYKKLITALLDRGADVNAKDDFGAPLTHAAWAACSTQASDVFRLLIRHGADVSVKSRYGDTLLMEVLGHVGTKPETEMDMLQALIECGVNLVEKNKYGQTALLFAACGIAPDIVKLLVNKGDDVNRIDLSGSTPLVYCLRCEPSDSVIQALLDCGAAPNVKDAKGQSPLAIASERGKTKVVRMLLAKGAEVDIRGGSQETPLMQAANQVNLEIVQLLVEHGASVNTIDDTGCTPLMWAVEDRRWAEPIGDRSLGSGHKSSDEILPVVQYLLQRGADINARSKYGLSVRAVAWNTNASVADWLADHGAHL